ncbi:MAG: putative DNA modification/repair radical SAM protein [Myxococcales bacterium]|nr:putative DNA modification/repair radical SAM protein [Myxococcales bacterium]MCB9553423.1 putative DNA modification/repair radical SAM protein [Myxococcales bacterium]
MEIRQKLEILAEAARYDASCASSGSKRKGSATGLGNTQGMGICHSYTPDGRCVSLLKVLLTNICVYDCRYCVNRVSNDVPRARFTPQEVVWLTLEFYKRNYIEGLFLSSGIVKSADHTMEQLAEVARALREEHDFRGYIHLKAAPGASPELIARAGRYADRLSANIELPTQADLDQLAPAKSVDEIEGTMGVIGEGVQVARAEARRSKHAPAFAPAGQSTQMVIGATPTPDAAIIDTAERLYRRHRLARVYYSAYSPIPQADGDLPATRPPLVREHRLYQADWLIRHYGFAAAELFEASPDLSPTLDPKLAWALRHRDRFPLDVHRATRPELLRVPGLGTTSVDRILSARRHGRLRLADLARLGLDLQKAGPFIVAADPNPALALLDDAALPTRYAPVEQLELFAA